MVNSTPGMRVTDSSFDDSAGRTYPLSHEKAFSVLLQNSVRQAIGNTLGQSVLGILQSTGLLDDAASPKDFHSQLAPIFGNGTTVLEKLVVKQLFRGLNIPYDDQSHFEYGEALRTAREVLFVEGRLK